MLRRHRAAHRVVWIALAVLLPVLIAIGFWLRTQPPASTPVRLEAPT